MHWGAASVSVEILLLEVGQLSMGNYEALLCLCKYVSMRLRQHVMCLLIQMQSDANAIRCKCSQMQTSFTRGFTVTALLH